MEDLADADFRHVKAVCQDFKIKNSGKYHDLFVQSDTLLLANALVNFQNICLETYQLVPARFLTTPRLA